MAWRRWCIRVSAVIGSLVALYLLMNARTVQLAGTLVPRVATADKVVALTFDDGPAPGYTEEIIATLERVQIPATFFVTGWELEQHPDLGRQLVAAGHALGNHSYSHQRMILVSPAFVRAEIERTDQLIRAAGYAGEMYFRPPYGKKLVVLPAYLARQQRTTVMWDVEPETDAGAALSSSQIADQVVREARSGSIILLHVMNAQRRASLGAVPEIVARLHADGYRFVTVPELLADGGQR